MDKVLLLTLAEAAPPAAGCGACGSSCAAAPDATDGRKGAGSASPGADDAACAAPGADEAACAAPGGAGGSATATYAPPRAAVLACRDALLAAGVEVELVTAGSDEEIDAALACLDGPPRADGLRWPQSDGGTRVVVAVAVDGQLRAVVRRLVRRYAPAPSRRPKELPAGRTLPDLPPLAILPLDRGSSGDHPDLAARLGLPRDPAAVARAVLDGRVQRLDLLRNDGGSVTVHGTLFGRETPWRARVDVDDTRLAGPDEEIVACAVANADGYAYAEALPLAPGADPTDGLVSVAVAVPVTVRGRFGRRQARLEVRRATGRAVAVEPVDDVDFLDDGVAGTLSRKRSWWIEPGAWGVYRPVIP
jgi:hypothetical protein